MNNTNFLNPWTVTGLIDSDGSVASIITPKSTGIGWQVQLHFSIAASNNLANHNMFEAINAFFGGIGRIIIGSGSATNELHYVVTGLNNCLIIRDHLLAYPLITYKLVYFQLWCAIIEIMLNGKHLTWNGLLEIIAFKAHFKYGLSKLLKDHFSEYTPISLPAYAPNLSLINNHWLAGFITGDGSFSVRVGASQKAKLGEQCFITVSIGQHNRSLIVLGAIKDFLGYGNVNRLSDDASKFQFSALRNINTFINSLNVEKAQILGAKALDYADFCKAVSIINNKSHLTQSGLEAIRNIASGMNSRRFIKDDDSK